MDKTANPVEQVEPVVAEIRRETGERVYPQMTIHDYKQVESAEDIDGVRKIAIRLGLQDKMPLPIETAADGPPGLQDIVKGICEGWFFEEANLEEMKRLCSQLGIDYEDSATKEDLQEKIKRKWECDGLASENTRDKCKIMKRDLASYERARDFMATTCEDMTLEDAKAVLKNHYIEQLGIQWVRAYDFEGAYYYDRDSKPGRIATRGRDPPADARYIDWISGQDYHSLEEQRGNARMRAQPPPAGQFSDELSHKAEQFRLHRESDPFHAQGLPGGGRKKRKFKKTNKTRKFKKTNKIRKSKKTNKIRKYKKTNKIRKYKKTNKTRKSNRKKSKR